eukprot:scaffold98017_cov54-Attheya_sp.AAC.2
MSMVRWRARWPYQYDWYNCTVAYVGRPADWSIEPSPGGTIRRLPVPGTGDHVGYSRQLVPYLSIYKIEGYRKSKRPFFVQKFIFKSDSKRSNVTNNRMVSVIDDT